VTIPILGQTKTDPGPEIRLLLCNVCKTIEELPPYDGDPELDVLLAVLVEKHRFPSGDPHVGRLFRFNKYLWDRPDVREEVIRQIHGGGSEGLDEFDAGYYDTKDTFREDAMQCYNAHLRPKGGCHDWRSDKKRLLPNTKAERKDAGLPNPLDAPGPKVYLCDFCPVRSYYMTKSREEKGMYK